jgi:hypothetical protein
VTEDRFRYMFCDYMATGEGRTICLMICLPHPGPEDYEVQPRIDEDWKYVEGVLRSSPEDIAARRFREKFGDHLTVGIEHATREEFLRHWGRFVPESVQRLSDPGEENPPANLQWHTEFHFNFS